jgi:hypothetical protein
MDSALKTCDYCDNWPKINDFTSIREFERFEIYVEEQKRKGWLIEISVGKPYASPNLKERWFKCSKCNIIWRLVYPDFPFKGLWDRV